jgi:hypothetical protein
LKGLDDLSGGLEVFMKEIQKWHFCEASCPSKDEVSCFFPFWRLFWFGVLNRSYVKFWICFRTNQLMKNSVLPGWSKLVMKLVSLTSRLVIQPEVRQQIREPVVRHRCTVYGLRIAGPQCLKKRINLNFRQVALLEVFRIHDILV